MRSKIPTFSSFAILFFLFFNIHPAAQNDTILIDSSHIELSSPFLITLVVKDIDQSALWYKDIFGFYDSNQSELFLFHD